MDSFSELGRFFGRLNTYYALLDVILVFVVSYAIAIATGIHKIGAEIIQADIIRFPDIGKEIAAPALCAIVFAAVATLMVTAAIAIVAGGRRDADHVCAAIGAAYPGLGGPLATARDNCGVENIMVNDLADDVAKKMDEIEYSSLLDQKRLTSRVILIVVFAFIITSLAAADFSLIGQGDHTKSQEVEMELDVVWRQFGETDDGGITAFTPPVAGTYLISAEKAGYVSGSGTVEAMDSLADELIILASSCVEVNKQFKIIIIANELPVCDATVTYSIEGVDHECQTDEDGIAVFTPTTTGELGITSTKSGLADGYKTISVVESLADRLIIRVPSKVIVNEPFETIILANGVPIGGVNVTCYRLELVPVHRSEDGYFQTIFEKNENDDLEDIYGEPSVVSITGTNLDLMMYPGVGSEFSIRETSETGMHDFEESSPFPVEPVASETSDERIEDADLVARYFEELHAAG